MKRIVMSALFLLLVTGSLQAAEVSVGSNQILAHSLRAFGWEKDTAFISMLQVRAASEFSPQWDYTASFGYSDLSGITEGFVGERQTYEPALGLRKRFRTHAHGLWPYLQAALAFPIVEVSYTAYNTSNQLVTFSHTAWSPVLTAGVGLTYYPPVGRQDLFGISAEAGYRTPGNFEFHQVGTLHDRSFSWGLFVCVNPQGQMTF